MSIILSRIAKLEEHARCSQGAARAPGISEETMTEVRRVAAVCDTWRDLAGYLTSLLTADRENVVSLEERRRGDAVTEAMARTIFEEEHVRRP